AIYQKIEKLKELRPGLTEEIVALSKKWAELPLNRAKKFVAQTNYYLFKDVYVSEQLPPDDLKAKFIHQHRALKKHAQILVELMQVKDDPEIQEYYTEFIGVLPQIFEVSATDFAKTTMQYILANPKEFFETKQSLSTLVQLED
ncbi:MAG: hypothetical protein Q8Q56_01770, partial [Alphaproteobacteria bacterium]|nr:hypothetical protein [Alphaproteobacteria bacterium]